MLVYPLIFLINLALTGSAILLIVFAMKDRAAARNVCGKCDYDLRGCEPDTARCPECGNDLASNSPRGGMVGRWGFITGVALLSSAVLLDLSCAGVLVYYFIREL